MFSFAVDVLDFDSDYFVSMIVETGTNKKLEEGGFACNNSNLYETIKQITSDMLNETVTEPFNYDKKSYAYRLGFLYCLCQQQSGLSYSEIHGLMTNQ